MNERRMEQLAQYRMKGGGQSKEAIEQTTKELVDQRAGEIADFLFGEHDFTSDELADVRRFANYAGKRNIFEGLHSPLLALPKGSAPEKAVTPGLFQHDLTHSLVDYSRKKIGMRPEFYKKGVDDVYTDPDILREEVFANVWGNNMLGHTFLAVVGAPTGIEQTIRNQIQEAAHPSTENELGPERARLYVETLRRMEELVTHLDRSSIDSVRDGYESLMGIILQVQYLVVPAS